MHYTNLRLTCLLLPVEDRFFLFREQVSFPKFWLPYPTGEALWLGGTVYE